MLRDSNENRNIWNEYVTRGGQITKTPSMSCEKANSSVCFWNSHCKYQAATAAAHVFTHVVSNLSLKQLLLLFQMNRIEHSRLVFLERRLKANRVQFFSPFWCEYLLCQSISSYLVWRCVFYTSKKYWSEFHGVP